MSERRMRLRRAARFLVAACAIATAAALVSPSSAANAISAPQLTTLRPGAFRYVIAPVHVNVVLVGYSGFDVDTARLTSMLPHESAPPIRFPLFYGIGEGVGLDVHYTYAVRAAGRSFDNAFFTHLATTGSVAGPDFYQGFYNGEVHHSVTVGSKVRYIPAADTESWLEQASLSLGISPLDDTVFLVNWYGRSDFQFHTYTTIGKPDPDTGAVVAKVFNATHVRAWGGGSGRSWFYDLSAGPVFQDDSFNVDDANLHNAAPLDYRMPPIWDYGHTGYRAFNDLTGDLAKIVRYVAIDMLFTAAPIYDPEESLPGVNGTKRIALDIFDGDPSRSGLTDVHPQIIRSSHQALEPYYPITISTTDRPIAGEPQTAYDIGTYLNSTPGCWSPIGYQEAEFFCDFANHYTDYFPVPRSDAVIPSVDYTVADEPRQRVGFQATTDDDFFTGVPTLITGFDTAAFRDGAHGSALTALTIHEAGHFVGLSHPHDGLDAEQLILWDQYGSFDFARTGDESATPMSYLVGAPLSFSFFDRDNLARWHVARLLFLADVDAGRILGAPHAVLGYGSLIKADAEFSAAEAAMKTRQWQAAGGFAADGFRDIQRADAAAGLAPISSFASNELWRAGGSPAAAVTAAAAPNVAAQLYPAIPTAPVTFVGPPALLKCSATDACPDAEALPSGQSAH